MSASTEPDILTQLKEWPMRPSPRFDLRPSSLWLALLATPLFVGQALAAPEVHLHVDGKPVAEALTLDKGTVTLTHRLDKGNHQTVSYTPLTLPTI